jgi:hypothetical protein
MKLEKNMLDRIGQNSATDTEECNYEIYLEANLVVQTSLPIHLHIFQLHPVMGPAFVHLL